MLCSVANHYLVNQKDLYLAIDLCCIFKMHYQQYQEITRPETGCNEFYQ